MNSSSVWHLEETILSHCDPAIELTARVLERLRAIGWGEQEVFGVHLALEEALMNAIKHGNQRDASKKIHVVVDLDSTSFSASITDEGCGFDPDSIPDPTLEENLEKATGRGISLIRLFMDEMSYNPCGNQIRMSKARQPAS